jgi:hypothetical protein
MATRPSTATTPSARSCVVDERLPSTTKGRAADVNLCAAGLREGLQPPAQIGEAQHQQLLLAGVSVGCKTKETDMSGKVTRGAFQQLIAEDIAWLEAQPRTLEREHIIGIVCVSERYYYDEAQDEAIKAARVQALQPLEKREEKILRNWDPNHPQETQTIYDIVNEILTMRREANQP